jgi:hypothetical protein
VICLQEAASTFVASLSAVGEAATGTDLLNNLHLPATLQGEGQVLPDDDAKDFSDISDFSEDEVPPGLFAPKSTQSPPGSAFGPQPSPTLPAPQDGSMLPIITAEAAQDSEVAQPQAAADSSLISLTEYLALADEQAELEALHSSQQLAASELLPSAEPLAAQPPLLHSAGLISLEHDEIAEAIMRDTYGIKVPQAEQARVVVDIVSFSESLVPREWFPQPRLAMVDPPDRHALVCHVIFTVAIDVDARLSHLISYVSILSRWTVIGTATELPKIGLCCLLSCPPS